MCSASNTDTASEPGLRGRHAVVTGGGRGIGAAIAHALASHGVRLTLMGRTRSPLDETASALRDSSNATVHAVPCDVADAVLAKPSPRGTLITPQEVADTVVWLCSAGASAITGQALAVAAGEVM